MSRSSILALLVLAACGGSTPPAAAPPAAPSPTSPAPAADTPPDHTDHIAAIDAFLADPTRVDPAPILQFMADSPAVTVELNADQMTGLTEDVGLDDHTHGLLLVGYGAGSARAQLVSGVKRHDFLAGLRGLLQVYGALQASVPALDEAAAAERAGTLDAWARDWQAKRAP